LATVTTERRRELIVNARKFSVAAMMEWTGAVETP
jgi:hypothetical protein